MLFRSLALIAVIVQPPVALEGLSSAAWISLFVKEAIIGVVIGLFFGLFLWAFEAAGVLVDMQIGASFALYFDPLVGNEVTPTGSLLGRWASYLFVASGGLLLLAGSLVESFAIWPVERPAGEFSLATVRLFETEFSRFLSLTVRIAGPFMLALFVVDVALGLVNRFAQQFNVFFLSMSVKAMASVLMLIVLLPYLATLLGEEIAAQPARVAAVLELLFGP